MITTYFNYNQVTPAERPQLATRENVRLPYGGPTGTGGKFSAGTVLGCVAGTVQSEVVTLTVGTATGTLTLTFAGDKVYTVSHAIGATLAAVQAAWEAVFGTGNVAVTGTPGTNYILTLRNQLANVRIGGLFGLLANGTAAWARTTRGSSGAGQYDTYLDAGTNSTPQTARAVLEFDYLSDPQGGLVQEGRATGQPYSPPAFFTGIFRAGDLTGLDANAMADPGFRYYQGTALADTGCLIALGL